MWRKGTLNSLLVGMQTGAATMENSTEGPPKLKMELPYDLVIPILSIYLKKPRTPIWKKCTPMLIAVLFTIAKIKKEHKCPTVGKWIKKWWYRPDWCGSVGWPSSHKAKVCMVQFSVRAHAWVVSLVSSWGECEKQQIEVSLTWYFSPSLSPSLFPL